MDNYYGYNYSARGGDFMDALMAPAGPLPLIAWIGIGAGALVLVIIIAVVVSKSKKKKKKAAEAAKAQDKADEVNRTSSRSAPVSAPVAKPVSKPAPVAKPSPPPAPKPSGPPPPLVLGAPGKFYGTAQGQWAGSPFKLECNKHGNDHVSHITGRSGRYVDQVGVKCASGTHPAAKGGRGGSPFSVTGPFTKVSGRAGWGIDNLLGKGGSGGGAWTHNCPSGTKLRAVHGKAGNFVGSLGFVCK